MSFDQVRRLALSAQQHLGVVVLEARRTTFRNISPVAFKAAANKQLPTLSADLGIIFGNLDVKPVRQGKGYAMRVSHGSIVLPVLGIGHEKEGRLLAALLTREEPLMIRGRLAALGLRSLDVLVDLPGIGRLGSGDGSQRYRSAVKLCQLLRDIDLRGIIPADLHLGLPLQCIQRNVAGKGLEQHVEQRICLSFCQDTDGLSRGKA